MVGLLVLGSLLILMIEQVTIRTWPVCERVRRPLIDNAAGFHNHDAIEIPQG